MIYVYCKRKLKGGGAKFLAEQLGGKVITPKSVIDPNTLHAGTTIINWGCSTIPEWYQESLFAGAVWLNSPEVLPTGIHKVRFLRTLRGNRLPHIPFTTSKEVAESWIELGHKIVQRDLIKSNSGKGIKIIEKACDLQESPLYTLLMENMTEYRAHVMDGNIIDFVQKKRKSKAKLEDIGLEEADPYIRSHKRGWVFARKDIMFPNKNTLDSIRHLGTVLKYTFGAVDFLYDHDTGMCYVLEINSSPGITDKNTKAAYLRGLRDMIDGKEVEDILNGELFYE